MKIIEGTVEEINDYLHRREDKKEELPFAKIETDYLRQRRHWSTTKSESIAFTDMNPVYIVNVMRRMLIDSSSKNLLEHSNEFLGLVLTLADKIEEGLPDI